MRHTFIIIAAVLLALTSCGNHSASRLIYPPYFEQKAGLPGSLDSLAFYEANHYDYASWLLKHPETLLHSPVEYSDSPYHCYTTSADRKFRVYSILDQERWSDTYAYNIIQYTTSDQFDDVSLSVETLTRDIIQQIGMISIGAKTYYLPITNLYVFHQGEYFRCSISAFSVTENHLLKKEKLFLTRDGRYLDTIDVEWDDNGGTLSNDDLFGIRLDSMFNTHEVQIQVIDGVTGEALNRTLSYKWDGRYFKYSGKSYVVPAN